MNTSVLSLLKSLHTWEACDLINLTIHLHNIYTAPHSSHKQTNVVKSTHFLFNSKQLFTLTQITVLAKSDYTTGSHGSGTTEDIKHRRESYTMEQNDLQTRNLFSVIPSPQPPSQLHCSCFSLHG